MSLARILVPWSAKQTYTFWNQPLEEYLGGRESGHYQCPDPVQTRPTQTRWFDITGITPPAHVDQCKTLIQRWGSISFMARVNIEDSLYRDVRFYKLVALLGGRRMALGALIEAWTVAQSQHSAANPGGRIPTATWVEQECAPELIASGLAIDEGETIYMRGGEEQFKWLTQRKDAGQKGGQAKQANKLATASDRVATAKPLTPTLTPTLTKKELNTKKNTVTTSPKSAPRDGGLIAYFCERWRETRPGDNSYAVTGRDAGQITRLVKDLGVSRTREVVDAYFKMPDAYITARGHTIQLLVQNLNQVTQFMNSGKVVTEAVKRELEQKVDEAQGQGKVDYAEVIREYEASRKLQIVSDK